jgi:Na+/H+ antiporter NhaD/arsenite permease-like protein
VLPREAAYRAVDYDTIVLLLGMMILSAYLHLAGFFDWAAHRILRWARSAEQLLLAVLLTSGALSALLVNDTVCLLLTPLVVAVILRTGLPLFPYLMALAMGANIGSVATLVGNPQNVIIAHRSGIPFAAFSAAMLPAAAAGLAIAYGILRLGFRHALRSARIGGDPGPPPALDRRLVLCVAGVLLLVFIGFMARLAIGLAWTVLAGAAVIMVLARRDTHVVLQLVDWHLLLFFAALFIVVEGLNGTGLPDALFIRLRGMFGVSPAPQAWNLAWFSVIGSNLFSNVPFVLVAGKWMANFAHPELMWKVLALATTFAGNLTLLGSVGQHHRGGVRPRARRGRLLGLRPLRRADHAGDDRRRRGDRSSRCPVSRQLA